MQARKHWATDQWEKFRKPLLVGSRDTLDGQTDYLPA